VHPYLAGGASTRIAATLAKCDLAAHGLAKRCTY
jgi:hypothetical protein